MDTNLASYNILMLKVRSLLILAFVTALIIVIPSAKVHAHEGRDVGGYNFVVGFREEPAYEGMLNAVSLTVTRMTEPHEASSVEEAEHTHDHSHEDANHGAHDHNSMAHVAPDESMLNTHGALFISPSLKRNETFEFEIDDDLSGVAIPYHVHPGDHEGVINVTDDPENVFSGDVMIGEDGISPNRLNVNPGDTVKWINHSGFNAALMSGPLSSMTSEMKMEMEAETEHANTSGLVSYLALQVEVVHIPTAASKTMALKEDASLAGHYTAEFIPTATGDYSFRIFGDIDGAPIDELFESGPNTFDVVVPADEIQFPNVLESSREVENAARGALDNATQAQRTAADASDAASMAMLIAISGLIVGIAGVGIGILGIRMSRRTR